MRSAVESTAAQQRLLRWHRRQQACAKFAAHLEHRDGIPLPSMVLQFCIEQRRPQDALQLATRWADAGWASPQAGDTNWGAWHQLCLALSTAGQWAELLAEHAVPRRASEALADERNDLAGQPHRLPAPKNGA
jgi:hypothetical protein